MVAVTGPYILRVSCMTASRKGKFSRSLKSAALCRPNVLISACTLFIACSTIPGSAKVMPVDKAMHSSPSRHGWRFISFRASGCLAGQSRSAKVRTGDGAAEWRGNVSSHLWGGGQIVQSKAKSVGSGLVASQHESECLSCHLILIQSGDGSQAPKEAAHLGHVFAGCAIHGSLCEGQCLCRQGHVGRLQNLELFRPAAEELHRRDQASEEGSQYRECHRQEQDRILGA
mmetsp:Transcript_13353/g.37836  ORF Transcript_13353/g.37836 Transcript_13353/m.37836 type:complete len:229 (+) Transcript_13353:941-1627(+)